MTSMYILCHMLRDVFFFFFLHLGAAEHTSATWRAALRPNHRDSSMDTS